MQQLLALWNALDLRKRVIVIGASVAMFAAVLGLSRLATQPTMALLYAGLEPAAAGEVIQALEAVGAPYEVRGGALYVPQAQRDELRLTLAADGLPASSGQGYELLDNLTGFGTTSQMFNAAYWRAKEGELARTITASPMIRTARVHLGNPTPQGLRQQAAATASVTLGVNGTGLPPAYARALRYLVASAVAGLTPENVSIIDSQRGLIGADDGPGFLSGGANAREMELRRNVERLLEARVGPGNAVVEVSIDTVTDRESIVERSIDPNSRIAISSETEERSNSSTDSGSAGVSVASNLPDGAAADQRQSSSNDSQTRERTNYEFSETTREVLRTPGSIRRLTVAVLVDGIRQTAADGSTTWAPRSEQELESLRKLVESAVGFDADRGDTITLQSLEFTTVSTEMTAPDQGFFASMEFDVMSLLQLGVLAVVSLILGLFVLRPILTSRAVGAPPLALDAPGEAAANPAISEDLPDLASLGRGNTGPDRSELPALTGEIDDGSGFPDMAVVSDFDFDDAGDAQTLPTLSRTTGDPVERLRSLIEERQSETVEILRGWMNNSEETA